MFTADGRDRLLVRLLDRARVDPHIAGAAVTGSAAAGTGDRWSDIDLFLGLTVDADLTAVLDDWSSWLHGDFTAVHHFDLTGGGATYRAFLLTDGLEIDLGFAPAGAFRRLGGETFGVVFGAAAPDLPACAAESCPAMIAGPTFRLCTSPRPGWPRSRDRTAWSRPRRRTVRRSSGCRRSWRGCRRCWPASRPGA